MTKTREKPIEAFLGKNATRRPLAGDASFRRYERISKGGRNFVLMDAPPGREDCRPFIAIARYLEKHGFSAPKIHKIDLENGLLLLEDLGDETYNAVLSKNPGKERQLYNAAIDVLVELHKLEPPETMPAGGRESFNLLPYNQQHLFEELDLFIDWYLPELLGKKDPAWREQLRKTWSPLFDQVTRDNSVLVLKDYHADNLMWLKKRRWVKRVGLLDFQDGRMGHQAYDLVSLLQDARREYKPSLEAEMVGRYLLGTDQRERRFVKAYQILGAQRNAKIIGIFTRLWKRDKKPEYARMIPHVWTLLEQNLKHPALGKPKNWFDKIVPGRLRRKRLV